MKTLLRILPCVVLLAAALWSSRADTRSEPKLSDDGDRFLTDRPNSLVPPMTDEEDAFSFVVYGDRTGGPAAGVAILAEAVRDTNLLGPDLVMTVGDLIEGYNQTDPWMTQMREYRGIMDRLTCPWYPVAGNHDVYWRGPNKPEGEHEASYEMHFGPLWYAFRHKSAWFIALYTDEGNPETGEKTFNKPECQRMSPEQFSWLQDTLSKTQGAEHVFVFCHHPRWLGNQYGDDWERVHSLLAESGNVRAVFAGHIHRMRYDGKRDGIEYVTLATVGGHQGGSVPAAGYLHHYNVVTVRSDDIDMATYPVGSVMDPRAITGELSDQARRLSQATQPTWTIKPAITPDGLEESAVLEFTWRNDVARPVEMRWSMDAPGGLWSVSPAEVKATVPVGDTRTVRFDLSGSSARLTGRFELPKVQVEATYLSDRMPVPLPVKSFAVPLSAAGAAAPTVPATERALRCGGGAFARLPAEALALRPNAPFTVEAWCKPTNVRGRRGLFTRTESSEWGLFVSDGLPSLSVHLDGRYAEVTAQETLTLDRWQHIAGVYDGAEIRLYLRGRLVGRSPASGTRTVNELPLILGGDVDGNGRPTSLFDGLLDEVRVSLGARYAGDSFTPSRRFEADVRTRLLLHMDGPMGPWLFNASSTHPTHPTLENGAILVDAN